jgi:hypothetical protein
MRSISRRDFLRGLALVAVGSALPRGVAGAERPFEFLVAGDSFTWGQGLLEKEKFYSLTADWLRNEAFRNGRDVRLKVKAHSGATLKLHAAEAEKFAKAGLDEMYPLPPEVNVGFPSIAKQIDVAADEYRRDGVSGADLVMVTGGVTDISTSKVFDPNGNDDELRRDIQKYCRDDMYDVIASAAKLNPNALIVVVGYFPAITSYSTGSKILNAWLEALAFPRPLKFVANNPVARRIFFNKLRKRAIERSRIWLTESSTSHLAAVEKLNAQYGPRAVFVPTPLTDEEAAEAPKTKLFRMGKGGVAKDPLARERIKNCREGLPELKRRTGIDYPVRLCEIAGIGHPDAAGARAYADAITRSITPFYK